MVLVLHTQVLKNSENPAITCNHAWRPPLGTFPRKDGGGALGALASTSFSLTTASLLGAACSLGTTGGFSVGEKVGRLSLDVFECAIVERCVGQKTRKEWMKMNRVRRKIGDGGCDQVMYRVES